MAAQKEKKPWVNSLDFKAWSIAYEVADPEVQKELIIDLVKKEVKKESDS